MKLVRQLSKRDTSFFDNSFPVRRVLSLAILAILSPNGFANPDGAQIINGQVSIDTSVTGTTTITNSPNAIIHWQNFNIAQDEIARFVQQNGQSAVLNRIIGENPSEILGQLVSNGKVFLINPNGVVFGKDAVVDTQGLIASTLNLSDDDFLKGNYHFFAGSKSGNIINEGIIRAGKDGNIVLIAPSITNNGIIKSEGGQITLAAGQELIITNLDDPDIRYAIQAPKNDVLNIGKLLSEGGVVSVFANTIKHQGEINADSIEVDAQGHVKLVAQQDIELGGNSKISVNNQHGDAGSVLVESKTGTVNMQGTITANAPEAGKGGQVAVLGERVALFDQAKISADGQHGGGEVLVGGDVQGKNTAVHNAKATFVGADTQISADAKVNGDGGKVVVWADQYTRAYGQISSKGGSQGGDGGFVETSGHVLDASSIKVDASAAKGRSGKWLLDPNNITIQAQGEDTHVKGNPDWTTENDNAIVTSGSIQAALNNGTSVTVTTGSAGSNSQDGDINVNSSIVKSTGNDASLSLIAHNDININAPILAKEGKLNLLLTPISDGELGGVTTIASLISLNDGTLTLNNESRLTSTASIQNASVLVPQYANSEWNGILKNIAEVTVENDAKLTINRAHNIPNTVFNNSGTLEINAFFVMNTLNLLQGTFGGSGNVTINEAFNLHAGSSFTGTGILTTAQNATTTLLDDGVITVDKTWNNLGDINWDGLSNLRHTAAQSKLTNFAGGKITINSPGVRELNVGVFNNHGKLELSDGQLNVFSSGIDKGIYKIHDTGEIAFLSTGVRTFLEGSELDSAGLVRFANGTTNFLRNSDYAATQTEIDSFGTVVFNTGNTVKFSKLILDGGTLAGIDTLEIRDQLTLHKGYLAGSGKLITLAGSSTELADSGNVYLKKGWENFGTVNWQIADLVDDSKSSVFKNAQGGIINIGNANTAVDKEFTINTARFNNDGIINIHGGTLKVVSPGRDTGAYQVDGGGQLQFWYGFRVFDNASIISPNTVTFTQGENHFRNNAIYDVKQTNVINEGLLNFGTNSIIHLANLTIDGGTLTGSDKVSISETFDFHSGIVKGGGLTTNAQSITTLADKDTVYIGKNWDNWGTIFWNGVNAITNPSDIKTALNNHEGGVFNIESVDSTKILTLGFGRFNNAGTLNLSSGLLVISSLGADTGSYQVTDAGQLKFSTGARSFDNGAIINSATKVIFADGGRYVFNSGSSYFANETEITGANVSFNTGNVLTLPSLSLSDGATLISSDAITIDKDFNFVNGVFTGNGLLTTTANAFTHLDDGNALLDKNWENFGNVDFSVTINTFNNLRLNLLPARHWNNYGTIDWQGDIAPPNALGTNIILTNKSDGIFNVSSNDLTGVRELNLGGFFNDGTVNVTSGTFQINSNGTDTGSYRVSGTGRLQFNESDRVFDGANISSANPITFTGGTAIFTDNAVLDAPQTIIDGNTFTINTPLVINKLLFTGGIVNNQAGLITNGQFDWSDGSLKGAGGYTFANGFGYTGGAMQATGDISITDTSGELFLPAMPSINKLTASSSGQLILTGDISAKGHGTAIMLDSKQFTNLSNSQLFASKGRWLVYSENPANNKLGGLSANFKHYGCTASNCEDGFTVSTANGNGLLYSLIPVLSVAPDKTSSVYGNSNAFTANYSGFIDGDDLNSVGLSGTANYAISGNQSSAGFYRVGRHEVSYVSGLVNQLGYRIQDNAASTKEWAITPRSLSIIADAAGKIYGDLDPHFSYQIIGLLAGDTVTGSQSRDSGENVGDYGINQGSLNVSRDYSLNYTANKLTISPRDLSIVADEQSKLLGELDPALTYKSVGLVNNDTLSGFLSRISGEDLGKYAILQGSLSASPNYRVRYTGAELTIKPLSILQEQQNQQQGEVLVLTQQASLNEQLGNVTNNNIPVNSASPTSSSKPKHKRNTLGQCQ